MGNDARFPDSGSPGRRASKKTIVVVEDEPAIAMALKDELEFEGYAVHLAEDGRAGLKLIESRSPDLVVLDLMLPGLNGFEICKRLRERRSSVPIIMLTARNERSDKIRGLDLGADDYITKPFHLAEVMARVRAVLRRYRDSSSGSASRQLCAGELRMDLKRHEVRVRNRTVDLTPKEFQLLELLLSRKGETISRDEFLNAVWGDEVHVTHRTVDTHLGSLRKKIEPDPERPTYIVSVRGVGYKLDENPTDS